MGLALGALLLPLLPTAGAAQDSEPLEVGAVAPDFSVPGAVRHGILAEPVTLSEYAGQTVVLAFFFRARTKG
jgi:peroxiredoxin